MCSLSVNVLVEYGRLLTAMQIDSVQRKFTKRLPGFAHSDRGGRPAALNIDSLLLRRLNLDLIFAYKILFWLLSVRVNDFFFFQSNSSKKRGHPYRLQDACAILVLLTTITVTLV